jgi:hypothetical protein
VRRNYQSSAFPGQKDDRKPGNGYATKPKLIEIILWGSRYPASGAGRRKGVDRPELGGLNENKLHFLGRLNGRFQRPSHSRNVVEPNFPLQFGAADKPDFPGNLAGRFDSPGFERVWHSGSENEDEPNFPNGFGMQHPEPRRFGYMGKPEVPGRFGLGSPRHFGSIGGQGFPRRFGLPGFRGLENFGIEHEPTQPRGFGLGRPGFGEQRQFGNEYESRLRRFRIW